MMKKTTNIALLLAVMLFGFTLSSQAISITVGTGDYYENVGDYDYLPYTYGQAGPGYQQSGLSFQAAMGEYGTWMSMQPFGQVWHPYVANDWRPYTQGHWNYTQYGPTWQGYEPWAWAGYHYGNWVFSQQFGWVWIPGYEWHPGRVAWAQGYNSIGWTPMPPSGYDYSRGYLSRVGPQNQFTFYDDDFSIGIGFGGGNDYYYGGPYYDPRYRNMYYNNSYLNMTGSLWTFLDPNHFGNDNYADYYYGDDYSRYLFDRRLIRISSRPIERVVLERIVRKPVTVRQVRTNDVQIDGRRVRMVAVEGEQDNIRKNANKVVREVIAPGFASKGKSFKGEKARNRQELTRALRMEKTERRVETVTSDQIVQESRTKQQQRESQRSQMKERKRQEVVQVEKQGKIKEKKDRGVKQTETEDSHSRSTRVTPEPPKNRNVEEQKQNQNQKLNNRPVEKQDQDLKRNPQAVEQKKENQKRTPPADPGNRENVKRNVPPTQENEDVRLKEKEKPSKVQPETDENIQPDNSDRSKNATVVNQKTEEKKKADAEKSKKAKSKKSQDKDKDKKQDEPPQD